MHGWDGEKEGVPFKWSSRCLQRFQFAVLNCEGIDPCAGLHSNTFLLQGIKQGLKQNVQAALQLAELFLAALQGGGPLSQPSNHPGQWGFVGVRPKFYPQQRFPLRLGSTATGMAIKPVQRRNTFIIPPLCHSCQIQAGESKSHFIAQAHRRESQKVGRCIERVGASAAINTHGASAELHSILNAQFAQKPEQFYIVRERVMVKGFQPVPTHLKSGQQSTHGIGGLENRNANTDPGGQISRRQSRNSATNHNQSFHSFDRDSADMIVVDEDLRKDTRRLRLYCRSTTTMSVANLERYLSKPSPAMNRYSRLAETSQPKNATLKKLASRRGILSVTRKFKPAFRMNESRVPLAYPMAFAA